jgi:protein-S-isoprenylcysteine O-methyltransferase Ste14
LKLQILLKSVMQKKKGIATDRMGKGQKDKRTFVIEVILKTITYLLAAAQLISIVLDTNVHSNVGVRYVGIAIALAGTIVFIVAMTTMRSSWRAGVDESQKTSMVTTGIYRFSRNPAFIFRFWRRRNSCLKYLGKIIWSIKRKQEGIFG